MLGNKSIISKSNSSVWYFRMSYLIWHTKKEKTFRRLRRCKRSLAYDNNWSKRFASPCNRRHWLKNFSLSNQLKWKKTLKSLTNSEINLINWTQWPHYICPIFGFLVLNQRISRLEDKSLEHIETWLHYELFWSRRRYQFSRCLQGKQEYYCEWISWHTYSCVGY